MLLRPLVLTSPIQIFPIPDTHACVIQVTKKGGIKVDEEITVKYLESGYYGEECQCTSCTRIDTRDLSVLKPNRQEQPAGDVEI